MCSSHHFSDLVISESFHSDEICTARIKKGKKEKRKKRILFLPISYPVVGIKNKQEEVVCLLLQYIYSGKDMLDNGFAM